MASARLVSIMRFRVEEAAVRSGTTPVDLRTVHSGGVGLAIMLPIMQCPPSEQEI